MSTNAPARTPIAFVTAILLAYANRGCNPEQALTAAQITPQLLENPAACITAGQMERISNFAMLELDDEALGWFNRRLPWGSYGMLARASISSPDLGLALSRWCRHHHLLTDDVTLQLDANADQAHITLLEHRDLGALREFCLVSLLRNIHGLACWLSGFRMKRASYGPSSSGPDRRLESFDGKPCHRRDAHHNWHSGTSASVEVF